MLLAAHWGPVPICFVVPPPRQSGTLMLVYDDTVGPAVDVAFTLDGAPVAATTAPPQPHTTPPAPAGGSHPSGRFTGTDNGLSVTFASDGSRITGFSANGGWTCGNGYTVMSFQLPSNPVMAADGSFTDSESGMVNGSRLTWQLRGRLAGDTATGTLQVQSSLACELYSTPWAAHS